MRMIDGVTLSDAVSVRGPLALRDAAALIEQLADALSASHALGLIHRDVKPANILIAEGITSHVYLTDFGIAHDTNAQDAQLDDQGVAGSPEYLAPEQLGVGEIGPWTDVYALAGVLVFCLTGAPPFPRATVREMLLAHLSDPPPQLSALHPALPAALDRVLMRGLAKAPAARHPTALEFAAEVSQAARDEVGSGEPMPSHQMRAIGADDVTTAPE
jgi:serine/threonine protein kinase